MPNIVLTGFMGTGKTTTGQMLAIRLERPFIDTDAYIVQKTGQSIPQIFAEQGEAAFRALEAQAAQDLAVQDGLVVSTGGGMLVNADNRRLFEASGLVVCLYARPQIIAERIASDTGRPLANDWQALYTARQAAYSAIKHQVDTSDSTPEEITEQIIALWEKYT